MLIVTDGAVDLPGWLRQSPLVQVVPGEVRLADDALATSALDVWALMRRGVYPSTTPPTVSALAEAYRHPGLVYAIHVSSELSSTVVRAREAATRVGTGVTVVDTRSLSVGAGLLAGAVLHAAEHPAGHESIIGFAQSLPRRLHTFALIQDIESLRRSDRSGLLPKGRLARNHPLLLAVRGRVVGLEQAKDRAGALEVLAVHVRRSAGPEIGAWALGHGDASDCDLIVEQLGGALGMPPSYLSCLDPTVGAHLGPESVVVGAISGPVDL